MPREGHYGGKDKIAGTPTSRGEPPNRPVGGLPEPNVKRVVHPRSRRRGG